jgi:site-specific DNA recombinase
MVGIYCRTSKQREEKYTLINQKESGIQFANQLDIDYVIYEDDGISGTLDDEYRFGLSDLFKDIKKGKITYVYCIDQSRIEREPEIWQLFVGLCLSNDVKYCPGGVFLNLDRPDYRLFSSIVSLLNSYYSELTSKKVRIANARKVHDGKTHGLKPYGYSRDENNKYKIIPDEAEQVRRMFQLSLDGVGTYLIAKKLNEEGVKTKFSSHFKGEIKKKDKLTNSIKIFPKKDVKWRGNVIHDMLRNPIYKGERVWTRTEDKITVDDKNKRVIKRIPVETIRTQIPPIVDPELWEAVNQNLENNKKFVGRKKQYRYLLNGLLYCGNCGQPYVGKKRISGSDSAYKCTNRVRSNKECSESRGVSIVKIDSFIVYLFGHMDEFISMLTESKISEKEVDFKTKKKQELEKELLSVMAKEDKIYELLFDPDFKENSRIKEELSKIQNQVGYLNKNINDIILEINKVNQRSLTFSTKLFETFKIDTDYNTIKNSLKLLLDRITIEHQKNDRTGIFIIRLHLNNFNEPLVFKTNWGLLKYQDLTFKDQPRMYIIDKEDFIDFN